MERLTFKKVPPGTFNLAKQKIIPLERDDFLFLDLLSESWLVLIIGGVF